MVTTLSVREVNNLRYLLLEAYVGVNQKYYRIMEEPLYSYDEEKEKLKRKKSANVYPIVICICIIITIGTILSVICIRPPRLISQTLE